MEELINYTYIQKAIGIRWISDEEPINKTSLLIGSSSGMTEW